MLPFVSMHASTHRREQQSQLTSLLDNAKLKKQQLVALAVHAVVQNPETLKHASPLACFNLTESPLSREGIRTRTMAACLDPKGTRVSEKASAFLINHFHQQIEGGAGGRHFGCQCPHQAIRHVARATCQRKEM